MNNTYGSVEKSSLENLSESEVHDYLKELLVSVIASLDADNADAIADGILTVDLDSILMALNNPYVMYDAISHTRESLGL